MTEKFFFDQDDSCHWYLVPERLRKQWYTCVDKAEYDEWESFNEWFNQYMINDPSFYTFRNPEERV